MDDDARHYWDERAAGFDAEADHGLRDPAVRKAWADLLSPLLPPAPATVADLGCGTGSLSVLLAEKRYQVQAVDLSPAMLEVSRAKAEVRMLPYPALWGREITDERYLLLSAR